MVQLVLPCLTGHEKAVKRGEVRVVVSTTSDEQTDRAAATKAGADGYMLKPEGFSDLVATLNRLGQRWLTPPCCA